VIRLEADDPQVRALTVKAFADSAGRKPSLAIRCAKCGALLAHAGWTKFGPLFTSSWTVESKKLTGETRQVDRMSTLIEQSGAPIGEEQHGVIALLAPPPALSQDHPDLLVRCSNHGDAVLDRQHVLTWLRDKSIKKVSVKFPLVIYRDPDPLFAQEVAARTSSRVVRRIGGQ
jgi:hypothetical protein